MTPEELDTLKAEMNAIRWWHSIDLGPELGRTPGTEPAPHSRDAYMHIPEDLIGHSVLDIGAWDGLYSFLAEERGATRVVAMDTWNGTGSSSWKGVLPRMDGFNFAKRMRQSKVTAVIGSVYNLDVLISAHDPFDVVFFFGVLYHLEDPMRALRVIHRHMSQNGLLILGKGLMEPQVGEVALMEFTEKGRHNDPTNVWYPNRACMDAMLRKAGFFGVKYQGGIGSRGAWHARRGAFDVES